MRGVQPHSEVSLYFSSSEKHEFFVFFVSSEDTMQTKPFCLIAVFSTWIVPFCAGTFALDQSVLTLHTFNASSVTLPSSYTYFGGMITTNKNVTAPVIGKTYLNLPHSQDILVCRGSIAK